MKQRVNEAKRILYTASNANVEHSHAAYQYEGEEAVTFLRFFSMLYHRNSSV